MSSRKIRILAVGVPLLIFFTVLIIGMLQSGRDSGRPGVNDTLGEVDVTTDTYSDFQITTLDGRELHLSDLRGSIVMVDFWSSWCPPCRAEASVLAEAYERWSEIGVEFVGVSIWDNEEDVIDFINIHNITYPNGIDNDGSIAVEFGVKGIPEKFFVNPQGEIVRKVNGPNTSQSLDAVLTQMSDEAIGIGGN
ncbi:MAG: TlpA family protein disulfide reductase [Chloroflexi bacterium]|nr:TlpA family protein disulfide reductase [Chloroflexota bacterium]